MPVSIAIALVATEGGIRLSLPKPWRAGFFVCTIAFAVYLAAHGWQTIRR